MLLLSDCFKPHLLLLPEISGDERFDAKLISAMLLPQPFPELNTGELSAVVRCLQGPKVGELLTRIGLSVAAHDCTFEVGVVVRKDDLVLGGELHTTSSSIRCNVLLPLDL